MTDTEKELDLPDALKDALQGGDDIPIVTASVDREIASLAADHFSKRRSQVRRFGPVWAAAAGLALVALIISEFQVPAPELPQQTYADVDGSGDIDIADVLALARLDSDISRDELDAFAMRIVSLSADGES